ncbi:Ribokinase-like protein [Kalaharituber pfeilii]|nr:Ribokinase-like protein [Kalaharituber pfeilii]
MLVPGLANFIPASHLEPSSLSRLTVQIPRYKMPTDADRVLTIASHEIPQVVSVNGQKLEIMLIFMVHQLGRNVASLAFPEQYFSPLTVSHILGLEVSALNTVQFSNHTGYMQWTGYRTTAEQIEQLWQGLKNNEIVEEYGLFLTGYVPGADGVEAVGKIGKELKMLRHKEGQELFWLLDPVMGDEGKLYVSEEVVPVYKSLAPQADLITPNQFETELLCGIKIDSLPSLSLALDTLHSTYNIPHIIITSVTFPRNSSSDEMLCAGSSLTSQGAPRKFIIPFPVIPGLFVGTGDMFSALTLARFREQAELSGLLKIKSWLTPDEVHAADLPLAKAVEKVLGSMHLVLERTKAIRDKKLATFNPCAPGNEKLAIRRTMKASELQLVKGQKDLVEPSLQYKAIPLEMRTDAVN